MHVISKVCIGALVQQGRRVTPVIKHDNCQQCHIGEVEVVPIVLGTCLEAMACINDTRQLITSIGTCQTSLKATSSAWQTYRYNLRLE